MDDDVFYAWMCAAGLAALWAWAYGVQMMPEPYERAMVYVTVIGLIASWRWCRREKCKYLVRQLIESEDMELTICDGCGKPVDTNQGYLKVEWDTDDIMVKTGGVDYSERQFHDWECVHQFVTDVMFMRNHKPDTKVVDGPQGKFNER